MSASGVFRNPKIIIAACAALILFQGCASAPPRNNPLPESLADKTVVVGIRDARAWGDEAPKYLERWLEEASDDELRGRYGGIMDREHTYLAISGGGANGAFGAGLLMGWSESGSRPEFTIVTGISTGGLTAPFAFMGPAYDQKLKEIYTSYSTTDLLIKRDVFDIIRNDAISNTDPLRALIAEYVDEEMMHAMAAEYRKGRVLMIGTTNIDAGRPVMWNIGRISNSGDPGALDLIHDIMLASAAIPFAFPPVTIEVEANGMRYEEMHVDGGVTSQVFLYPLGLDWRKVEQRLNVQGRSNLFVIRNAHMKAEWKTVDRRIVPIVGRTIDSLIRTQGIGDLLRLYLGSVRDGLEFHVASIPEDFGLRAQEPFDRDYMVRLFERGRTMAEEGYPWVKDPYGLQAESKRWRPED
jgi:predicted acylesterase/phospholipase RssA